MATLYQRLGGYDAIASVVDELFARKCGEEKRNGINRGHSVFPHISSPLKEMKS